MTVITNVLEIIYLVIICLNSREVDHKSRPEIKLDKIGCFEHYSK